jgi:spore germination protein YaaH
MNIRKKQNGESVTYQVEKSIGTDIRPRRSKQDTCNTNSLRHEHHYSPARSAKVKVGVAVIIGLLGFMASGDAMTKARVVIKKKVSDFQIQTASFEDGQFFVSSEDSLALANGKQKKPKPHEATTTDPVIDPPMTPPSTSTSSSATTSPAEPVTYPTDPAPLPAPSAASSNVAAWIYPGEPACGAVSEFTDGRNIDVLKPEYYVVGTDGKLLQRTAATDGCNGYSPENAAKVKQYSNEQYATVAANAAAMSALVGTQARRSEAAATLAAFTTAVDFTGVELDFEGFHRWSSADYANYKLFLSELGNTLHAKGKKLMIDGPAFGAGDDPTAPLPFRYDEIAALPVDYIVIMAYDYQYDYGVGSAIAPNQWVKDIIAAAKQRIADTNKIVIGIPAYGYHGPMDTWNITIDTKDQSEAFSGFSTAVRDPGSFELFWERNGIHYRYADSVTIDQKRALIEAEGIKNVSVWHLGGNDWFTN